MNTLLLALTAASLLVLVAILLFPRLDEKLGDSGEDERISPLLRGINYLLSDEPDLALQEMVQVARLRSEAVDVYMALGEMFRSRGEYGRAVRIHQNLLARPDLATDMQVQAHFALARDFHAGGLLDRALNQYRKVLALKSDHVDSLESSLRIREQSSEWLLAEELLSRLEQVRGKPEGSHRAYLFAEVARDELEAGNTDEAGRFAAKALELDTACAPARMVKMELALVKFDYASAAAEVRSLARTNAEHFPLLIPAIMRNREFYSGFGRRLLLDLWKEGGFEEMALAWLESVSAQLGVQAARELKEQLHFEASGLRASLRLQGLLGDPADVHARYARKWREGVKNYVCEKCGVEVHDVRWQCPQCHTWGSMHSIKGDVV